MTTTSLLMCRNSGKYWLQNPGSFYSQPSCFKLIPLYACVMNTVAHYLYPEAPWIYKKIPICYKYEKSRKKNWLWWFSFYYYPFLNIKIWTNSAGVFPLTLVRERSHPENFTLLWLPLRLCFSALHVVCGFCGGSSSVLFCIWTMFSLLAP